MDDNKLNNIPNINMLYQYAMDNSEYVMIKEMFMSALFFNTAAAMALRNIRIKRKSNNKDKIIIPNYFGITFSGSGSGKNHSDNIARSIYKPMFEKFNDRAYTFFEARRDEKRVPDPRYLNMSSYFVPVTSSWQALQKAAQTVKDMDVGAVNVISDELGDTIMQMADIFTKLKSTWDTGQSEGPLNVTSGGEAYFLVENVVFNALMFGAPAPFELTPAKKDRLLETYVSGMARRSFIYHNNTYKKSENRNALFEKQPKEFYDNLDKYILELRHFINNTEFITYPQEIRDMLLEYDSMKELERERSHSLIAEDLGSTKKMEKLLGIIATIDLEDTINVEHLKFVIDFTEAMDKTAEETIEIKPVYQRIYNEIEKRSYTTRTEIIKSVKDITVKDLDSQMILVQEHANILGNSLIKKEYDGIVKYKIEKLSTTSLDNIIISINADMRPTVPQGFIRKVGTFKGLADKIINADFRYSAGSFRNDYINDANYLQEQNLFIIDIDNDLTLEDAKNLFSGMTYLIATTRTHQKEKKGITCDRFRIILPTMSTFHLSPAVYSDMYMNVINSLGIEEADTQCRNASRWYYGNQDGEYWYNEGELLDIRTFIPDSSEHKEASSSVNKYDTSTYDAPASVRVDAALRWFLANTSKGNRNKNIFLLGALLKDSQKIAEPDWAGWLQRANSCLAQPLSESDMKTTINSIARRVH